MISSLATLFGTAILYLGEDHTSGAARFPAGARPA
jgi:hypothetical protein